MQDLAWGAADDRSRNWREMDPRRVEDRFRWSVARRRAARVGSGFLAARRSSRMSRLVKERRSRIWLRRYFRVKASDRLACQAQALGAVSIVIPPWNGVFGKYLKRMKIFSRRFADK